MFRTVKNLLRLWVPRVENASAVHRSGSNADLSLEGDIAGDACEARPASNRELDDQSSIFRVEPNSGQSALELIAARFECGAEVTFTCKTPGGGAPCVAGHEYTVIGVNRDAAGEVVSVVLRDARGRDGAGRDESDDSDVTLTAGHLAASTFTVTAAWCCLA
jgi:hypothetical protein